MSKLEDENRFVQEPEGDKSSSLDGLYQVTKEIVEEQRHKIVNLADRRQQKEKQGQVSTTPQTGLQIVVIEGYYEEEEPCTFRIAQYPDGRQLIQGGYYWVDETSDGFIWRDLPVVLVNAQGQIP